MYDPVAKAVTVAQRVCDGERRKYHRFRAARFYGGIATADCLGCCLSCAFCWSWRQVADPEHYGRFYTPAEVADRLIAIARRKGYTQVRISGNEPTLCRAHLLKVIELIPGDLHFILETNGILLGYHPDYAEDLARFPNVHVRVSLKGACEAEFSRLTGAAPEAFDWQLQALRNLSKAGASCHAAVMVSFSSGEHIAALRRRLADIDTRLADFEVEELVLYGDTEARLSRARITYRTAYAPANIPPEQI